MEKFDLEVVTHPTLAVLVGGKAAVYRGLEGPRVAIRELSEAFAEIHLAFSESQDLDDRIVAIGRIRARGTEAGAGIESPWGHLVQLKKGKAISIRGYMDPNEAFEGVGLRD
jgi:ketosteroid isomerase-like protein